ncbi:putative haloacid dehalogenase-like hydrolase [Lyophyllum shimeji]|uniref:Haloacid dehalogenase-like hydrolase n=1 Tax=Lyophyllum shimeji TaxID=47721 RepID=A0A9P3PJK7_LYOSH|nr:putative haloacid dehalogenase-like hydrolase [Lyophyllum shimeji]
MATANGNLGNGTAAVQPKIEYVLFDMDGLMIDSEKIYTDVTNEILGQYGKKMTWDMKAGLMGKPERQAAEHLLSFFPDIPLTLESYLSQRNTLQDALWPTVPLLPGVRKLVLHLKAHNIPIAVATGSRRRNFELKTGHLGEVFDCFEGKVVCGDDTQFEMNGKPAPDIFLVAAREMLGRDVGYTETGSAAQEVERAKGLVFEDGVPGMQAGKRAGMSVIWVPDANLLNVGYTGEEKADRLIKSIEDFIPEEWGLPPYTS